MNKRTLPDFKFEEKLWDEGYKIVVGVDEVGRGAWAGPVVAGAVVFKALVIARSPADGGVNTVTKQSLYRLPRSSHLFRARNDIFSLGIDDSKRLTAKRREKLARIIKKEALAYGLGEADVATINRVGIVRATEMAIRRAVADAREKLSTKHKEPRSKEAPNSKSQTGYKNEIDFLLVDAFYVPHLKGLPVGRKKSSRGKRGIPMELGEKDGILPFRRFAPRSQNDRVGDRVKDGLGLTFAFASAGKQKAIIHGDRRSITIAAASIIAKVYRDKMMVGLSKKYRGYGFEKNKGYGTKKHQEGIEKLGVTRVHRKRFVETGMNGR